MQLRKLSLCSLLVFVSTASIASAHPGHGVAGFGTRFGIGVVHPLTGLDHLLAMIGVGLIAVALGKRWVWALPCAFVGSMIVGAALGASGVLVPTWIAEFGIAMSVFAFGVLITLGLPLPRLAIAVTTGVFAICHGSAHAAEMPEGSSVGLFFVGFITSTMCLHALGIALGLLIARRGSQVAFQSCGLAMSVCGLLMLAGVL